MERRHRAARRDRAARFTGFGPGHYASRTDKDRKARNHFRQLEALGFTVTLALPPDPHRPIPAHPGHGSLPRPAGGWLSG